MAWPFEQRVHRCRTRNHLSAPATRKTIGRSVACDRHVCAWSNFSPLFAVKFANKRPKQYPPCNERSGVACAGSLSDQLKESERYKPSLEPMLVQHVIPCFRSSYGHLREKACWVAGCFADIEFSNNEVCLALLSVGGILAKFVDMRLFCWFRFSFFRKRMKSNKSELVNRF